MNSNTLHFVIGAWSAIGMGALTYGLSHLLSPTSVSGGQEREAEEDIDETMADDIYVQQVLPLQVKAHPDLIAEIQRVARALAANGAEVSTDDIHEHVTFPPGVDRRVMGAAFLPKRDWELCGYHKSKRADCHSRTIARWRLKVAVAA